MIEKDGKYTEKAYRIKKSEIILLLMDFLRCEHLDKTLVSLEQETSLSLFTYNQEVTFFRKLILDGQWQEAEEFLQPIKQNINFPYQNALFEIRKQKFLEEVETEPENNNEVDKLVKQLKEIQKLCSKEEFNKLLSCLSSTPSISEQDEYKNWNAVSGRLMCFEKVRKLMEVIYPIKEREYNAESHLLINLIKSLFFLTNDGNRGEATPKLSEVLKGFIAEVENNVKENKIERNAVIEHDYGNDIKRDNNLLKSTRNEMIISQSIQSIKDEENKGQMNTIVDSFGRKDTDSIQQNIINNNNNREEKVKAQSSINYYYEYQYNPSSFSLKIAMNEGTIVRTSCFSRKGNYIAIGTNLKSIKIYDIQQLYNRFVKRASMSNLPKLPLLFEQRNHHAGSIYCIDWSVSQRLMATGSNDKTIKFLLVPDLTKQINDDEEILELPINGHSGKVRAVKFDPNSDLVLFSAGVSENVVKIWNSETGEKTGELCGHTNDINSLKWSKDAMLFASAGEDRTIRFWDMKTNKSSGVIQAMKYAPINDISILCNGNSTIVSAGHNDGIITIWDYYSNKLIKEIKASQTLKGIKSVEFSPDGKFLVSGGFDHKIKLYDVNNNFDVIKEMSHNNKVISTNWHPLIPLISSTSPDQNVCLWTPDKY